MVCFIEPIYLKQYFFNVLELAQKFIRVFLQDPEWTFRANSNITNLKH